jgi:hypothetical protein
MATEEKNTMSAELARVFDELHQDMCHICLEWNLFRELFAESKDRLALLDRTAKALFSKLHGVLQDSVYLGLTRMTDPEKTGQHYNLTIRQLIETARGEDPSLLARAGAAVTNAEQICLPFRDHRNKRIAHSDLPSSMKGSFVRPSRQSVEDAIKSIEEVMNIFYRHYKNTEYRYKHIIFSGGGDALDCYLRAGVYFHELRRKVALGELKGDALADAIRSYSL